MNGAVTLQWRLRKVQRELEEARLITSFTGDVGMTTEHPPTPPAMSSVNEPPQPQGLAPLSMNTRVLDAVEPIDLSPGQQALPAVPQGFVSYPVPVNVPPAGPLLMDAADQVVTSHPNSTSPPVVQTSSPEHAAPSSPSFHQLASTAPQQARSQRSSLPSQVSQVRYARLNPLHICSCCP